MLVASLWNNKVFMSDLRSVGFFVVENATKNSNSTTAAYNGVMHREGI